MYLKTQKFLIIGASKSGFAVAKYLIERGADCRIYEELKSSKAESALTKLKELGVQNLPREQVEEYLLTADVLVLSPGVPINHELAIKAKQMGKRIMGELEFAYENMLPTIVSVTGTNGKTTTVTLIDIILEKAGINKNLVGNVGVPMTSKINDSFDAVNVVEVSSFQLESITDFKPHISCVLNISPDHLERHYTMDNYIFLKKRIFKNQRESEYCVLNFDDQTVKGFFAEIKAKVVWVSIKNKVDGAYESEGKIFYKDEFIMDTKDLKVFGEHNVYNVLFAVACAKLLGVSNQVIACALSEFSGVKHRIELIASHKNVDYFNDSKATNTASTISAISALTKPTILILGGSEKGESYDTLFEKIKSSFIKHVILTGNSKYNMLDCASKHNLTELTVTEDFAFAIKFAKMLAMEGDAILLSPACASYDKFSGYEERGDEFVKIVKGLIDNDKT